MIAGIWLKAFTGSFRIDRTPFFQMDAGRRMISTVELHVHDMDGKLFKGISVEDDIKIDYGYYTGDVAAFEGKITGVSGMKGGLTKITANGTDGAFVRLKVTESFNDDTPVNIIKHLCSLGGIATGTLDVPDEPVPHIIFSNTTLWQAFAQLREMILRNGYKEELDYWMSGGKLHWGGFSQPDGFIADSKVNLISHTPSLEGYSYIELVFSPSVEHSGTVLVNDTNRGFKAEHKIRTVRHVLDQKKTRTYLGYTYDKQ